MWREKRRSSTSSMVVIFSYVNVLAFNSFLFQQPSVPLAVNAPAVAPPTISLPQQQQLVGSWLDQQQPPHGPEHVPPQGPMPPRIPPTPTEGPPPPKRGPPERMHPPTRGRSRGARDAPPYESLPPQCLPSARSPARPAARSPAKRSPARPAARSPAKRSPSKKAARSTPRRSPARPASRSPPRRSPPRQTARTPSKQAARSKKAARSPSRRSPPRQINSVTITAFHPGSVIPADRAHEAPRKKLSLGLNRPATRPKGDEPAVQLVKRKSTDEVKLKSYF